MQLNEIGPVETLTYCVERTCAALLDLLCGREFGGRPSRAGGAASPDPP
ncbi:hypothetical protein J2129_000080 [Methanofollis sp. W23]|nr:hypothetical protein [Methanofollis sp. W23]